MRDRLFLTKETFDTWFSPSHTHIISHRAHYQKSHPNSPHENTLDAFTNVLTQVPTGGKICIETDVRKTTGPGHQYIGITRLGLFISHDSTAKEEGSVYPIDLEKEWLSTITSTKYLPNHTILSYNQLLHTAYNIAKKRNIQVLLNLEAKTHDCLQDIIEETLSWTDDRPDAHHHLSVMPSSFDQLNIVDYHLNFPEKPAITLITDEEISTGNWTLKKDIITHHASPCVGLSVNALLSPLLVTAVAPLITMLHTLKKGVMVFTINDVDTFTKVKAQCLKLDLPLYAVFSDEYALFTSL